MRPLALRVLGADADSDPEGDASPHREPVDPRDSWPHDGWQATLTESGEVDWPALEARAKRYGYSMAARLVATLVVVLLLANIALPALHAAWDAATTLGPSAPPRAVALILGDKSKDVRLAAVGAVAGLLLVHAAIEWLRQLLLWRATPR
jgi:hypothetical protein